MKMPKVKHKRKNTLTHSPEHRACSRSAWGRQAGSRRTLQTALLQIYLILSGKAIPNFLYMRIYLFACKLAS